MANRKPRQHVSRRGPKREPYDRVLIVCEGSKTEPKYFQELVDRHRLSTANIVVTGIGEDPIQIVQRAKMLRQKEQSHGEKYDSVYCVFDRDEHSSFDQACAVASESDLKLARSWPCFEFWLLLHFRFTRAPYARSGGRSPAENCIRNLRIKLPNYNKAMRGIFAELECHLEDAKTNARLALVDAVETNEYNPSTEIHELVCYLQSLK